MAQSMRKRRRSRFYLKSSRSRETSKNKYCPFALRQAQGDHYCTRAWLQSSSDAAFRKSRIEEWRGSMVSLQTRPSKSIQLNSSAVIARVIAASAKELD